MEFEQSSYGLPIQQFSHYAMGGLPQLKQKENTVFTHLSSKIDLVSHVARDVVG